MVSNSSNFKTEVSERQKEYNDAMAAITTLHSLGLPKKDIETLLDFTHDIEHKIIQARRDYGNALLAESDTREQKAQAKLFSENNDGKEDNPVPASESPMAGNLHTFGDLSKGTGPRLLAELGIRKLDSTVPQKE